MRSLEWMNSASAEDVAREFADNAPGGKDKQHRMRVGVRLILGRIADQPGATWQERWAAAGEDNEYVLHRVFNGNPEDWPGLTVYQRRQLARAMRALIDSGVLRPGLMFTLCRPVGVACLKPVIAKHRSEIDRVITAISVGRQYRGEHVHRVEYALAAMIVFTGLPLSQMNVDHWALAQQIRHDALDRLTPDGDADARRRQLLSLATAYAGAVGAGLTQPRPPRAGYEILPPTLNSATRAPRTLDSLLAVRGSNIPARVASLIYDAYSIDGMSLDWSTLKAHVMAMNSFFLAVNAVLPGHDCLTIPVEHRAAILELLKRNSPAAYAYQDHERQNLSDVLGAIRSVYRLTNHAVAEYELSGHLPTTGTFPYSDAVVANLRKKEKADRQSRMQQSVRADYAHLNGLMDAADDYYAHYSGLLAAAEIAVPGTDFDYEGTRYRRAMPTRDAYGTGPAPLKIRHADIAAGPKSIDIRYRTFIAARARALVILLRETGLRLEEAEELRIDNIDMILVGDVTVPVINTNPSKPDEGRTVALTPRALEALHDLISITRSVYGRSPLVTRFDNHEHKEQSPARLIFFSVNTSGVFRGPDRRQLTWMLNEIVDHYNRTVRPIVPLKHMTAHQFRRLFSTDLYESGADVMTIKEALGHKTLSTTSGYIKPDRGLTIADLIEARRRADAAAQGTLCACCDGLGYTPGTAHPHAADNPTNPLEEA